MSNINEIKDAMIKKALGYQVEEVVEEYVNNEDEIKLQKRKVTKKNIPPDISAIKVMLDMIEQEKYDEYDDMDETKLLKEKLKLIKELEQNEISGDDQEN